MNVISEQKMRTECYYRRKKNIYDADKEKCIVIKLLETLEETTTTKMRCLTGEVAVRVKTNVIVIFI